MIRKLLVAFSLPLILWAQSGVFFSEYIEGTSNNKALEIYNGSNSDIDLFAENYVIQVYSNGNSNPGNAIRLRGFLPKGKVHVFAHNQFNLTVPVGTINQRDTTTALNWYNGDDAIVLRKGGASGEVIDVIGQIGFRPNGGEWRVGNVSTLDMTLIRKPWITKGDNLGSDAFDPSLEWMPFALNYVGDLGKFTPVPLGSPNANLSASALLGKESERTQIKLILTLDKSPSNSFNVEIQINGTGITTSDYSVSKYVFSISPTQLSDTLLLTIEDDLDEEDTELLNFSLVTSEVPEALFWGNTKVTLTIVDNDKPKNVKNIGEVQGTGSSSPLIGQTVTVYGTITYISKGQDSYNGFFIQAPYLVSDGDTNTSDAIWVDLSAHDLKVHDFVEVTGTVSENFNLTQLTNVTVKVQEDRALGSQFLMVNGELTEVSYYDVLPTLIAFPMNTTQRERKEGMLVKFSTRMTATENFNLGRYGEITLSSQGRIYTPTMFIDPNDADPKGTTYTGSSNKDAITAQVTLDEERSIILDDNSTKELPNPIPYFSNEGTCRLGSYVDNLTGVLSYNFGSYRVLPTENVNFVYNNRPQAPSKTPGSNLRVCAYNVENLFNGVNSVFTSANSRGAQNLNEYKRQIKKIAKALKEIDADIFGLIELENDGFDDQSSLKALLDTLNGLYGSPVYTMAVTPSFFSNLASTGLLGRDAIKNGYLYKNAIVELKGYDLIDDTITFDRIPLIGCFQHKATGTFLFPNLNHFKSKGCGGSTGIETDQLDGQSCWNPRRVRMADTLVKYIESKKCTQPKSIQGKLILGDLNAYREEDPIDFLRSKGYIDLFGDKDTTYSFVFYGQAGSLDHAFADEYLASRLSAAYKWHLNCDEPIILGYGDNDRASNKPKPVLLNMDTPYRSSDHDPIILDFRFEPLSVSDQKKNETIGIFPNPGTGKLRFEKPAQLLSVHNTLGESLSFSQLNPLEVDLSHLPSGIYLLKIISEGQNSNHTFVKH